MMEDVYIIQAVRSPVGKRGKGLAGLMPADLLGAVQRAALERSGIDPARIGQVIGGCVSQVAEQSLYSTPTMAWIVLSISFLFSLVTSTPARSNTPFMCLK